MLRLPQEVAQLLRELPDTTENAFYWREYRRGIRRGEPWRGFWNAIILLGAVFCACFFGFWGMLYLGIWPFDNGHVPATLGGQDGGRAVFALLSAAHALVVYYTAKSMANGVLSGEGQRGTLFQLMMTRIPALEMLLHMAVYPFRQAMLIAMVGLPFYCLLISFGSIGYQEVFVLYLLFLWLSIAVPNWRSPAFSEQSPEEVGQILRDQGRSSGCATFIITFLMIPGSIFIGSILYAMHYASAIQGAGVGAFATRVPEDVWPALPALPITFMWVTVRLLTAPYTWFGLPLPPWVWVMPLLFLQRLSALWYVSFYLRVAHPAQIVSLPDIKPLSQWRAGIRSLWVVALLGYLWQPTLETGAPGRFLWSTLTPTGSQNLAGALYLLGVVGFFVAMARARKYALRPRDRKGNLKLSLRWMTSPLSPFALGMLVGLIGSYSDFFSPAVGLILLILLPAVAAGLFFAMSMGPGSGTYWQAVFILPVLFCFIPWKAVSAFGALSPIVAMASLIPRLPADFARGAAIVHLPPAWAGIVIPLMAGAICHLLWKAGLAGRAEPTAQLVSRTAAPPPIQAGHDPQYPMLPPPGYRGAPPAIAYPLPVVSAHTAQPPAMPPGAPPALDFVLDGATETASSEQKPPVIAAPPVIALPQTIPPQPAMSPGGGVGTISEARPYPQADPQYYPPGNHPPANYPAGPPVYNTPRPTGSDWRWRPLSPIAAGVLRWLVRRTDNPVALYSARRVLPGTLDSGQIAVGIAALLLGMLVACVLPQLLLVFVLPYYLTPVLFPQYALREISMMEPQDGLVMLVTGMVFITMLSPLRVCANVTNAVRLERERSTMGFLLATPLSSLGVAVGHCVGSVVPALTIWLGTALLALIPTTIVAVLGYPLQAFWGWGFGFFMSLMYLAIAAVTGAWIGITEQKARDMTIGVFLLPISIFLIGAAVAIYMMANHRWGYFAGVSLFLGIDLAFLFYLWQNTLIELHKMRHGDVPFEGRSMSN